jgi:cupin 2 domain-containing protein
MLASLPREIFEMIPSRPNLCIERIVAQGQASPKGFWYDQDQHEFVVLLQGAARLRFEE